MRINWLQKTALLLAVAATISIAKPIDAQQRGDAYLGNLPEELALSAVATFNSGSSSSVKGRKVVEAADTVHSTLAVLNGPLILRGTVLGDVVLINGNLRIDSTAVITGSVLVIGGSVSGRDLGRVDGNLEIWRTRLSVEELNGELAVSTQQNDGLSRFARWRDRERKDLKDILITSAHTYNRVEGLTVIAGPRLRLNRGDYGVTLEALGIFRTGDRIAWERENLGHNIALEFRDGADDRYIAVGLRHIDEIAPVESWSLSAAETGITSFLFARDYRDYWNRFGGHIFLKAGGAHGTSITLSAGSEEWESREAKTPFVLMRRNRSWRPNPTVSEGEAKLVSLKAVVDTRNDPTQPRSGLFIQAEYEHGELNMISPAAQAIQMGEEPSSLSWGQLMLDLRRYNRINPHTGINMRLLAGGLLHGDALPAQRKHSVSGVDAIPAYSFRSVQEGNIDSGMCNTLPVEQYMALGSPAGCDRILLMQLELKGDFRIGLFGTDQHDDNRRWYADGLRADGSWVLFANSGRGWLRGEKDGGLSYPSGSIPLGTGYRSDIGIGLDFGNFGVYTAVPLNGSSNTPRFFARLGARF